MRYSRSTGSNLEEEIKVASLMNRKKNNGKIFGNHKIVWKTVSALTHTISLKLLLSRCFTSLKLKISSQASCYFTSSIILLIYSFSPSKHLPHLVSRILYLPYSSPLSPASASQYLCWYNLI